MSSFPMMNLDCGTHSSSIVSETRISRFMVEDPQWLLCHAQGAYVVLLGSQTSASYKSPRDLVKCGGSTAIVLKETEDVKAKRVRRAFAHIPPRCAIESVER